MPQLKVLSRWPMPAVRLTMALCSWWLPWSLLAQAPPAAPEPAAVAVETPVPTTDAELPAAATEPAPAADAKVPAVAEPAAAEVKDPGPSRMRCRSGWVLVAELAPQQLGEMIEMVNLNPGDEPAELGAKAGYALVTLKLDAGRSFSRMDMVLESEGKAVFPCLAIRVDDSTPFDAGSGQVSADNPFRYCQLLFAMPMPDDEVPHLGLRFKLFEEGMTAPILPFRRVANFSEFTKLAAISGEGLLGVNPATADPAGAADATTESELPVPAEGESALSPVAAAVASPDGAAVILHLDFETDAEAVAEAGCQGEKCMVLKGTGAWLFRDLPIQDLAPEAEYRITLMIKKSEDCSEVASNNYVTVVNYDKNNKLEVYCAFADAPEVPRDNAWHTVTSTFRTTPGLNRCSVYLYNKETQGTLWADEIKIEKLP